MANIGDVITSSKRYTEITENPFKIFILDKIRSGNDPFDYILKELRTVTSENRFKTYNDATEWIGKNQDLKKQDQFAILQIFEKI